MNSDEDKNKSQNSVQSEYDEIADEAIETLNRSGDFTGTEIDEPAQVTAVGRPLWHHPWFAIVCSLLVANTVYYYAARDLAENPLSRNSADTASRKLLADIPELGMVLNEVSGRLAEAQSVDPRIANELVEDLVDEAQGPGHRVEAVELPCGEGTCYSLSATRQDP